MATIGNRIRELRNKRNLTQDQLAEKINANRVTIANYERGQYKPSTDAITKIADALNTSIDYLLGNNNDDNNTSTSDHDIKFAVFGDPNVTDAQFEEVKQFARFIQERDKK